MSRDFGAASGTIFATVRPRTARFVHFRDHSGFQQGARRSERDFVRAFVLDEIIPPLVSCRFSFHANQQCALFTVFARPS